MSEIRAILREAMRLRFGNTDGEREADALMSVLDAVGLAIVSKDFIGAARTACCPSDGRVLVGTCFDDKACGCTIGLHLTAAGVKP